MAKNTTQESYKENNIGQLLKDLDKYASDAESTPVTAKSSKDDIYLKFTELLLNLGKHQKSWDAFKNVVDSSIQKMRWIYHKQINKRLGHQMMKNLVLLRSR